MKLAEKLDQLRQKFPECQTLAFADISTGMVLCSSAAETSRQEYLDSLCDVAVDMLNRDSAKRVNDAFAREDDAGIYQAIIIETAEIGVFLKSTNNPSEALCGVCTPGIELEAFIQGARENLDEFGGDP